MPGDKVGGSALPLSAIDFEAAKAEMERRNREKNLQQGGRTVYFDYLKILATLAVVMVHISALKWDVTEVYTFEWKVYNFYDSIVRWAVPVFVMISGALFLQREYTLRTLYGRYILRIVTAYLFWSCLYAVCYNFDGSRKTMVYTAIRGHYHMWFLPMIIGLYIIVPLLYEMVRKPRMGGYFLALAFVFAFLLPQLLLVAMGFGGEIISSLASSVDAVLSNMHFHLVLGYAGYFVGGYVLSGMELDRKKRWLVYALGIVGFLMTILASTKASAVKGRPESMFLDYFSVNVMLESVAVFVWFKYNVGRRRNAVWSRIAAKAAKYSFGAYLVHVFVILKLTGYMGMDRLLRSPLLAVPAVSLLVFGVSLLVSGILNHIPLLKKYIV